MRARRGGWGIAAQDLLGRFPGALSIYMLAAHDFEAQAAHDYRNVHVKGRRDLEHFLRVPLAEATILVLGCGYSYPDVALYADVAARVVGIDTLPAFYRDGPCALLKRRREAGVPRQLARRLLFGWKYRRYYRRLRDVSGRQIRHVSYQLCSYDGVRLPFPDGAFDAVVSNAVLEHVADLGALFRELRRVVRPGGIAHHLWHNFHSFSGGHVPEFLSLRHPWGHLRGKYATPTGLYARTPTEIEALFAREFAVVASRQVDAQHRQRGEDGFTLERPELLTAALREELRAYREEELLVKQHLLIGRRRSMGGQGHAEGGIADKPGGQCVSCT